jgi:spermidine synthase
MLPATFLAGMTLPLITFRLLRTRQGERSIGHVYAANTFGAIIGVMLAVHVGLPWLGIKGTLVAGAAIDVALGIGLLQVLRGKHRSASFAWSFLGVAGLAVVSTTLHLDPLKLASGVFSSGLASLRPGETEVAFHRDGKTASVDILKWPASGIVSILTNGKSDGGAVPGKPISGEATDEHTMILLAALPLAHHPGIREAAVIGFGTGMSTSALLAYPAMTRVDTIEIEPAIIEAARHFLPLTDAAYGDPRSNIVIDDAKSYFARSSRRYDLIVSEPSNPWVSGVASLYTREFYRRVRGQLNPQGLLAQWIHVYSFNAPLFASVLKALRESFPHVAVYAANDGDVVLIASPEMSLNRLDAAALSQGTLPQWLSRIEISGLHDLELRRIGDGSTVGSFLSTVDVPPNSDFFPFVDAHADRARFLNQNARQIIQLGSTSQPITEMLDRVPHRRAGSVSAVRLPATERVREAQMAELSRRFLLGEASAKEVRSATAPVLQHLLNFKSQLVDCRDLRHLRETWDSVLVVASLVNNSLPLEASEMVWDRVIRSPCYRDLPGDVTRWIALFRATGRREPKEMFTIAEELLAATPDPAVADLEYLYGSAALGRLAIGDIAGARQLVAKYDPKLPPARRQNPAFVFFRNAVRGGGQ